ncbi:WG repeat-containing protein [Candidatus Enterococcus leclercqii]|uniref:WG repeat-containing protein n=1 Tax=Candidatus Enterococcus leclercqii TaxID=1857218 RepID=UPI00137AF3CD|nr:WG repeat-containing protein [Enterococcus sp. CU9D]KAF1294175.1 hypothetical protein BAU14_07240 [Enterococcus sp. CU9D]
MVKCPNCGAEMPKKAKFCAKCGHKLVDQFSKVDKESHESESSDINDTSNETSEMSPHIKIENIGVESKADETPTLRSKKKNNKNLVIVIICILGLIGAGFGIWYVLAKENLVPFWNSIGSGKDKTAKVVENKEKAAKSFVFPYRNGNYMGLMNDRLEIVDDKVGTTVFPFNEQGVAAFSESEYDNYKVGLIDKTGTAVVRPIYDGIGDFYSQAGSQPYLQSKNGVMNFYQNSEDGGRMGLIDSSGKIVVPLKERYYASFNGRTLTTFTEYEKTGIINEKGKTLLEAVYDQATVLSDKYIAVKEDNEDQLMDIINLKGEVVKEDFATYVYPNYSQKENPYIIYQAGNGKYGLLDGNLKTVVEAISIQVPTIAQDSMYMVVSKDDGESSLLDGKGNELFTVEYSYLTLPNEKGIVAAMDEEGQKSALLDLKGDIVKDLGQGSVFSISGTNLFTYADKDFSTGQILDWHGEQILEEFQYFVQQREMSPYLAIYNGDQGETITYTLVNKDGVILSKNVLQYNPFDNGKIFIQEPEGKVQIWDSVKGNVLVEKQIEVEKPTIESSY